MRAGLGVLVHEMLSLGVGAFLLPWLLAPVSVAALVLPCEEANNKDMGSIGFRPSDTGTCLPGAEPQLSGVSDYKMVIDVANWESSQMVSMIMGILLSEHMGYDVIFNYAPLLEKFRRLLVPLPEDMRPTKGIESTPWLWDKNSAERRQVLGSNLACVADATDRFALSNMEVWNIPFGPGTDWIGESFILGDKIGYHGQSGWFVPAFLSMGVASLWSSYRDLRGQPPQAWRDYGFNASDLVNCSNANLGTCFPESGRGTPHDCRVWCRRASSSGTIPLWAIIPTYDAGYNEEIIYNNELDISIVYAGTEEQERKVLESFNASDGGLPGPIMFYSWEPSTLLHRVRQISGGSREDHEVSRLFLPNSVCRGTHMANGPPDSRYRCELPPQYLAKLISANMRDQAPFAYDFLRDFKISQAEIEDLLQTLIQRQHATASMDERRKLMFDVACSWVHRAGRAERLPNTTEDIFIWRKYSKPMFWYSNIRNVHELLLRNFVFVAVAIISILLVERVWITSSLDAKHFVRGFSWSFFRRVSRRKKSLPRAGSSITFRPSWPMEDVQMRHTNEMGPQDSMAPEGEEKQSVDRVYDGGAEDVLPNDLAVQVCTEFLWCKETDESVSIGVFLNKPWKDKVSVGYCTEDGTGKAGERYEHQEGEIVFEPNERVTSVDIKILDSQDWDAGTYFEFSLRRSSPEHIPPGLCKRTRVRIIDQDSFPKNKGTSDERRERMSKRSALFEHLRHEYGRLRRHVWFTAIARTYCAAHETLVLPLVEKFVLDEAVGRYRDDTDYLLVLILGSIFFASTCCRRVAEYLIIKYSKAAGVSAELEKQLYDKLWVIQSLTRDTKIQPSRWIVAVMRHAQDVAFDGWYAVSELVEEIACLLFIVLITLLLVSNFLKDDIGWHVILPPTLLLCLIPLAWWLAVECRRPGQVRKREELDSRITQVYDGFNWLLVQGKDLVRLARGKNIFFLEEQRRDFRHDTSKYAEAFIADNLYQCDSGWLAQWMSTVIHTCFFITGSYMLIERKHYGQGVMGVGTFVAMLRNFSLFGKALRNIFRGLLRIENASYALHQISILLNSETQEMHHLQRQRAAFETFLPGLSRVEKQDRIFFENVTFGYYQKTSAIVSNFQAELPLGRIICLRDDESTANQQGGQSTLLRLLAGDLLPTEGKVLLPPHLRVGIVETTPALIAGSLLSNITVLALQDSHKDSASRARLNNEAWDLAQKLGLEAAPHLLASHAIPTTSFIVMTARVLLSDPDVVLVLTSRWQGGAWLGKLIAGLVRWQQEGLKALLGKDRPKDRARSRTLILTADSSGLEHLHVGDVYHIVHFDDDESSQQDGVAALPRSGLSAPHPRDGQLHVKLDQGSPRSAREPMRQHPGDLPAEVRVELLEDDTTVSI